MVNSLNIEIQLTDQLDYSKRALYCWSKLYPEQLKKGENDDQLHKTIYFKILNYTPLNLKKVQSKN